MENALIIYYKMNIDAKSNQLRHLVFSQRDKADDARSSPSHMHPAAASSQPLRHWEVDSFHVLAAVEVLPDKISAYRCIISRLWSAATRNLTWVPSLTAISWLDRQLNMLGHKLVFDIAAITPVLETLQTAMATRSAKHYLGMDRGRLERCPRSEVD